MKSDSNCSEVPKHFKTRNLVDIKNSTRFRQALPLGSMRSATPDTIINLAEISNGRCTERKSYIDKALEPISYYKEKRVLKNTCCSSQTTKRINSKKEALKQNQVFKTEEINQIVSYKDFKKIHKYLNSQRKLFIAEKFNIKCKVKKIYANPVLFENTKSKESLLLESIYKKPAITFAEKLYRLQQLF